jgi:hypothetical protein
MSDNQTGIIGEQYRFMVIFRYSNQAIYLQEEKKWTQYVPLRNTTANFPPFTVAAVTGNFTCY